MIKVFQLMYGQWSAIVLEFCNRWTGFYKCSSVELMIFVVADVSIWTFSTVSWIRSQFEVDFEDVNADACR